MRSLIISVSQRQRSRVNKTSHSPFYNL